VVILTQRARKRLLIAANGALAAGILIVLAAGLAPVDVAPAPGAHMDKPRPRDSSEAATTTKPLGAYAVIGQRNVRGPLFDPKPQPVRRTPPPKLRLTLRGTMVEPGCSYAILAAAGKSDQLASVGETIGGAEVVAIESGAVTVVYHGRSITLTVPTEGAKSP